MIFGLAVLLLFRLIHIAVDSVERSRTGVGSTSEVIIAQNSRQKGFINSQTYSRNNEACPMLSETRKKEIVSWF